MWRPSPGELERACCEVRASCACESLRRTTRAITRHYERALAPSGLHVTQLPILVALGSVGAVAMTQLADALEIDRTTLTRNLEVLEGRGLVDLVADDVDGRVRRPTLTGEGERVLTQALERWRAAQDAVERQFGPARLQALRAEMSALAATLAS